MEDTTNRIPANTISLCVINVLQSNKSYHKVTNCIDTYDSDIILLVETDDRWSSEIHEHCTSSYPYVIDRSRDDTYGMLLLSKLEILDYEISHIYDETPQIRCTFLKNGKNISFFGLHPKPPAPGEASTSIPKDAELLITSNDIQDLEDPKYVLVAGDINDVAWSKSTKDFTKNSNLLDPRRGRGTINTFPAHIPWMSFPLDQIFCSRSFSLVEIKRLQHVGSDHFPLLVTVQMEYNR